VHQLGPHLGIEAFHESSERAWLEAPRAVLGLADALEVVRPDGHRQRLLTHRRLDAHGTE
jgi:hypothetical protein